MVDIGTEGIGCSAKAEYSNVTDPLSSSWNNIFGYRIPIQWDLVENKYLWPRTIWSDCGFGRRYASAAEHGWIDGDKHSWWQPGRNTCLCLQSTAAVTLSPYLVIRNWAQLTVGCPRLALIHIKAIPIRSRKGYQHSSLAPSPNSTAAFRYSSPQNRNMIGCWMS